MSPVHVPAAPEGESARPSGGFEPLPDDTWFNVKVLDAELRTASTGSIGVRLDMEVEDGPYKRRRIFDTMWITPKSAAWFREKVSAFGIDLPEGPLEFDEQQLVGRRAAVITEQETYTNAKGEQKVEARPKAYDKRSGSGLSEDWREQVPATPVSGGQQDDDVPFAASKV